MRMARIRRAELDQRRADLVSAQEAVALTDAALAALEYEFASLSMTLSGQADLLVRLSEEFRLRSLELDQRRLQAEGRLVAAQKSVVDARGELRTAELFLDRNRR